MYNDAIQHELHSVQCIYYTGRLCQIMAAVLVEACVSGELATVQSSLTHSPDLIHTVTQDGLTLLMHSVVGAGTYYCVWVCEGVRVCGCV